MRILLSGFMGFMGREVTALAKNGFCGARIVGGVDQIGGVFDGVPCVSDFEKAETDVDVIVDFSHHSCTQALLGFAVKNRLPLVLATTGQTEEERAAILEASKEIPLFFAANYSLGIVLLTELAKKTAQALPEAQIEIIEKHHNRKIDAPSGTALAIADAIRAVRPDAENHLGRSGTGKRKENEIGIHAVRLGNIVGEHEVIIGTDNQTITLKHEAHSRALFAEGALSAAKFLCGKPKGLYDMKSLVNF